MEKTQFINYGFYKINTHYLEYLYHKDSQVFYEDRKEYGRKPYLGMVIGINNMKYCIPLTSAKPRHLHWSDEPKHNIVIYEIVDHSELKRNDIYKRIDNDKFKKLLAVLEIRKMIPVDEQVCTYIDFNKENNTAYKELLQKEYNFLKPLRKIILKNAKDIYNNQKKTGVVKPCFCTFAILEAAYKQYFT